MTETTSGSEGETRSSSEATEDMSINCLAELSGKNAPTGG